MAEKKETLRLVQKSKSGLAQGKKVAPKAKKVTAKASTEKVVKAPKAKETEKVAGSKTPEWIAGASKQDLITEFATKGGDTGSPEVQVALATHKILNLTMHLEQNPKDNHSRRGLLKVISKRRRILNYLNEKDNARYKDLIKKVNLTK